MLPRTQLVFILRDQTYPGPNSRFPREITKRTGGISCCDTYSLVHGAKERNIKEIYVLNVRNGARVVYTRI